MSTYALSGIDKIRLTDEQMRVLRLGLEAVLAVGSGEDRATAAEMLSVSDRVERVTVRVRY